MWGQRSTGCTPAQLLGRPFRNKDRRFEGFSHGMLYISLEEKCEVATLSPGGSLPLLGFRCLITKISWVTSVFSVNNLDQQF